MIPQIAKSDSNPIHPVLKLGFLPFDCSKVRLVENDQELRLLDTRIIIAIIGLLIASPLDSSAHDATEISQTIKGEKPRPEHPEFTWDRIPLYMHIRKAKTYSEEEIKFLGVDQP